MSSHHVVRDTQEPALIIANGETCSRDLLDQLLEWNPIVMVLDGALPRVIELGIKIDIVLGDFDREHRPEQYLAHQYPVEIIHTPDQEKTDLQKGIELLITRNHKAINIIWATGKRADHTLNNLNCLATYKDQVNMVVYDDYSKIFCLPKSFDKWYIKDANISLMPLGLVTGITSSGLSYNLSNDNLETGVRSSSSNSAAIDGTVKITHESGHLLLMECKD
jgi:thiamine pyrophosphokinase